MIEGTLAEIERALPSGFHDAELASVEVDWPAERIILHGNVDFSSGGPPEVRRAFQLEVTGLRTLALPSALAARAGRTKFTLQLRDEGWCGGVEGWPSDRRPENPPFPEAWVYSFFLHHLNDFITVQAHAARFNWTGEPQPQ